MSAITPSAAIVDYVKTIIENFVIEKDEHHDEAVAKTAKYVYNWEGMEIADITDLDKVFTVYTAYLFDLQS